MIIMSWNQVSILEIDVYFFFLKHLMYVYRVVSADSYFEVLKRIQEYSISGI